MHSVRMGQGMHVALRGFTYVGAARRCDTCWMCGCDCLRGEMCNRVTVCAMLPCPTGGAAAAEGGTAGAEGAGAQVGSGRGSKALNGPKTDTVGSWTHLSLRNNR